MIFGIDIDIANLIVQAFIGLVTLVALIVAFWQGSQSKRNREDDIKRYQPSRISAWYEGDRNRTDQPEDNRFVWQFVVLRNESESPVYDVIVTCVGISGAGPLSNSSVIRLLNTASRLWFVIVTSRRFTSFVVVTCTSWFPLLSAM